MEKEFGELSYAQIQGEGQNQERPQTGGILERQLGNMLFRII